MRTRRHGTRAQESSQGHILGTTFKGQQTHTVCVDGSAFAVPEADHELQLAYHLLGKGSRLDLAILEALLGTPQRFRDLKPLAKGSSDTPLTRALKRLGEQGLVRQGMNLGAPGDPRYYAATRLGVQVILKSHELRPVSEVLAEIRNVGLRLA